MDNTRQKGPEAEYLDHLNEGRFLIQRSRHSGQHVFYPRVAAPGTGHADLEWVEPSGYGTVYSTTVVFPKPPAAPFNVALITLDEGPRMMSRVVEMDPEAVTIGLRVRAFVGTENGSPIVLFRAAGREETS